MKKAFAFGLVLALVAVGPALAQKPVSGPEDVLRGEAADPDAPRSDPNSFLDVDITGVESWDGVDDSDNTIFNEFISDGASVTGLGWDVTIQTVGASWLSEAATLFTDSTGTGGIFLTPGAGVNNNGGNLPTNFVSPGIVDFTDVGLTDIPVLDDGLLVLQFYETFDDVPDAIDATYPATEGTGSSIITVAGIDISTVIPIVDIPTASTLGLIALFIGLAALGVYLLRR